MMPVEPTTAAGIVVADSWRVTLEGKDWFLGESAVGDDCGYIFATQDNLQKLQERRTMFIFVILNIV